MGGAATCRAVRGGHVVLLAVYPEELAAEVEDKADGDERGSLSNTSGVLEGRSVFCDRNDEGFGFEGLLSKGGRCED